MNYENGYLYWVEKADSKIVRMKTDGTGREDVVQDRITAFIINNATLYYLNSKEPDSDGVIRGMKLIALEIFTRRTREFDLPMESAEYIF